MTKSVKNIFFTFGIGCVVFVIGNTLSGGFYFKSIREGLTNFVFYQLYSFVIGYSNTWYFNYLERYSWKKNNSLKRVITGIIGSTIITLIGLFILRFLTAIVYRGDNFENFIANEKFRYYQFGLWVTLIIVIIFHLVYFYNRYQQNRIKEQKVIAGTASAKFNALKNQLDPHFLFNSLNVLTSLIEENPVNAQKFTTSLSKVYRYVLEQKNKELVTVDEELKFAKTYMSLLKMRFEDSIIFSMPDSALNPEMKVVPLSLQLLLENAVKHNMVTSSKPLRIKIYEDEDRLVVENNLQPKQIIKKSSGVGLDNIKQRYKLLTRKKVNVNKEAERFIVTIPMLIKETQIMEAREEYSQLKLNDKYIKAEKRLKKLKGFYWHAFWYIAVNLFLLITIAINTDNFWHFGNFTTAFFWGIGLAIHAFCVFGNGFKFIKDWEDRKVREYMNEDKKRLR